MVDPAGPGAVRADHADPALGRPAPQRNRQLGHGGGELGGIDCEPEVGELEQPALDLGSRPQLERAVVTGHGTLSALGALGDPPHLPRSLLEQPRTRGLAQPLDLGESATVRARVPVLDRLVRTAEPAAPNPALEPVDAAGRVEPGGAQVGEHVLGAPAFPTAASSSAITPAPVSVRVTSRSAWTATGIPKRVKTRR